MLVINEETMNEARELVRVMRENIGETSVIRSQEFTDVVIEMLNENCYRYECKYYMNEGFYICVV